MIKEILLDSAQKNLTNGKATVKKFNYSLRKYLRADLK